jgi:ferric enterobactin transport system, permease component
MLKWSGGIVSLVAVLAGLFVAALIYLLARDRHGCSGSRMILIGIGMQAMLNALISWMLLKGSEYDVATALRWLRGSLNGVQMSDVPVLSITVLVGGFILIVLNRSLQVMQLGEEYPITLGAPVQRVRLGSILCALLLTAVATSITGPIASVAFLSGPIASRIVGKGRTNLLASALVGVVLILASELVGQNLFAVRYPVGVITGILGAPYLLLLLLQINKKGERV